MTHVDIASCCGGGIRPRDSGLLPGAVPRTSTYALNNVTLPYALALADRGPRQALLDNPNFLQGLNVCRGMVTYRAVANDLGYEFVDPAKALAS